jgi:tRNA A-37 threonylcarbamoyl transferase component Bud32
MNQRIGDDLLIAVLEGRATEAEQRALELAIQREPSIRLRMEQLSGAAEWPLGSAPLMMPPDSESLRTAIFRMNQGWEQVSATYSQELVSGEVEAEKVFGIPPLRIVREIGRGGMGVVYEGFDDALRRRVAIKQLHPHSFNDPKAAERLKREAQSIASLSHPNVLAIYGIQQIGEYPCLVEQFIDGESLQAILTRDGAIPFPRCTELAIQIAQGLSAAHAVGIVHRDLKPDNVLVEHGTGIARLCDFGLAKRVGDGKVTVEGMVAGTPAYMAPEQADGAAADHRSDLFSLGALMYSMAAGTEPFGNEDPHVVMSAIRSQSHKPLHTVTASVPYWYARLVDRLLEKQPEKRPHCISEVLDLLKKEMVPEAMFGEPRRKQRIAAVTSVILAGMAFGWFVLSTQRSRTSDFTPASMLASPAHTAIVTASNGVAFSRLEDAIANAIDGERIVIANDLESTQIEIKGKRLQFEAAPGTRPVIRFRNPNSDTSNVFLRSDSDLSLKGLRIECRTNGTIPWFEDGRFIAGIYTGQGKRLRVEECDIFRVGGGICLGAGGDLEMRGTWIEGGDVGIGWFAFDNTCRVEETLVHSKIGIGVIYPGANMKLSRTAEFVVERSSLVTEDVVDLLLTRIPSQPVSLTFHQSVLDSKQLTTQWMSPMLASETTKSGPMIELFVRSVRWQDSQCVFAEGMDYLIGKRLRIPNRKISAGISSLEQWAERCAPVRSSEQPLGMPSIELQVDTIMPAPGTRWRPRRLPWVQSTHDQPPSLHRFSPDIPADWSRGEVGPGILKG